MFRTYNKQQATSNGEGPFLDTTTAWELTGNQLSTDSLAMDVVLELFDTYVFDRLYATVLPIRSSVSSFNPISTISASFKGYDANATFDPSVILADGNLARSGWQFEPASQFFSFQPSEYAWQSRWDRDNIYRQAVSFYLITWSVHGPQHGRSIKQNKTRC